MKTRLQWLVCVLFCLTLLWPVGIAAGPASEGTLIPLALRGKIDPQLLKEFAGDLATDSPKAASAGRAVSFLVYMREQADLEPATLMSDKIERRQMVFTALRETAARSQRGILAELEKLQSAGQVSAVRSFWVFNGLAVTGDLSAALALAARPEVEMIRLDRTIHIEPQEPELRAASLAGQEDAVAWGISKIRADLVWGSFGITGDGIVVANMDTGVDYQHPALLNKYRGNLGDHSDHNYNWFDTTGTYPSVPDDGQGHGTHTMGTIVGSEADGSHAIGVAPGAKWVAVKIFTDGGDATDTTILQGFQWILAPTNILGANPDPSKAPDIVSNSWGSEASSDTTFQPAVRALRAAGILPVFAAGNEGPGPRTVGSPGSFPESIAVGACDSAGNIASFSSRGPSPWNEIKPEITAPGVDIYSSVPGGGYERGWNGTSMATPHVAGLVALLWEADRRYNGPASGRINPTLTITATEELIKRTAHDLAASGPDNDSGWGLIDAYEAVRSVIPYGTLRGRVTDQVTAEPVSGALLTITSLTHGGVARVTTDAQGYYSFGSAAGLYDVSVSQFFYNSRSVSHIEVLQGTVTQLNFSLQPRSTGMVRGLVSEQFSGGPLAATIEVLGTEVSAETDALGAYTIKLPAGVYTLRAFAKSLGYRGALAEGVAVLVGGEAQRDFSLAESPLILLVNADAWRQDRPAGYYESALKDNLYNFAAYDILNPPADLPTAATLMRYDLVIWSQPKTSPGYVGAWPALAEFLGVGGRLFMTGQDIGYWDVERDSAASYYHDFLHSNYVRDDVGLEQIVGAPGGILSGLSFSLNADDSAQNQRYPSEIAPLDGLAIPLVNYAGDGCAGVQIDECGYRALYLAFGFEGIGGEETRQEVMRRAVEWLAASRPAYALQLSASSLSEVGVMGSAVRYPVTLVNTGLLTQTIALSAQGHRWPVAILDQATSQPLAQQTLGPCASRGLWIEVQVPSAAAIGDADTVTVTAASLAQPGVRSQVTLRTVAFPTWRELAPLPTPRSRAAAIGVDRRVYVIGGESSSQALNLVNIYEPATNSWLSGKAKPTKASNLSIAALGAKIYAPGGYNDSALNVLEIYDTITDSWATGAAMPGPRYGAVAAAVGDKLYVIGGSDNAQIVGTTWEYAPSTNSWKPRAEMAHARAFAAAGVVDGKIYVIGGTDATSEDIGYVEVYDPASDTWTSKHDLPAPRMGAAAVELEGYLYLVGGGYRSFLADALRYDPATDSWQSLPPLAHGRRTLGLAAACGALYAVSGWDGDYRGYNEAFNVGASLLNSQWQVSDELAQAGAVITYTASLANLGADDLPSCSLRSPLPAHTVLLTDSLTGGISYDAGVNQIVWSGAAPARATLPFSFQVRISANTPLNTIITGTAIIEDGRCGPYVKRAITTVGLPELSLSAKGVSPAQAVSGQTLTYAITLSNDSLVRAAQVSISDTLPAEVEFLPGTLTEGATYDPLARRISWQGNVPAGRRPAQVYEWADSDSGVVTYDWIDASGGTALPGGDDVALGPFPIGFTFEFYGKRYSEFYLNTNGQLLFGTGSGSYANTAIPNPAEPSNFIAAFWDDLTCSATCLRYQLYGLPPHRYLVVEWLAAGRYGGSDSYTFEIVLHESSNVILLQYQDMTGDRADGMGASIGIEDEGGIQGAQYLFDGAPADNLVHGQLAVRFTPPRALLPGKQVIRFQTRVREGAPVNARLVNSAAISDGLQSFSRSATATVNVSDLSGSTKAVDKRFAVAGEALTYTISIRNRGNIAAQAVWTDTLPGSLELISDTLSGSGGPLYDPRTRRITWQGAVAAGSATEFQFAARIVGVANGGQTITNTVEIADLSAGAPIYTIRSAATAVFAPDLSTSYKSVSRTSALAGEPLTYTIALVNSAPVPAPVVSLWDALPEHTQLITGSLTGGAIYDPLRQGISWTGAISAANWAQTTYALSDSRLAHGVAYDWVEIRERGRDLELVDDSYAYIRLPFAFQFYGQSYTQIAVGSNGTLHFADSYLGKQGACLPAENSYGVSALIAAFWDDLNPAASGRVYYALEGSAPYRRLIVEWADVACGGDAVAESDAVTFEAILYEGSNDIVLQYQDMSSGDAAHDRGASATVGIQADAVTGVTYSCDMPLLADGLAIRFAAQPQPSEQRITFQVSTDSGLPVNTQLTNTAIVTESALVTYTRSATTTLNLVDLSPSTKEVWPKRAGSGAVLTYTITLRNGGEFPAEAASLTDTLPAWVDYLAGTLSGGAAYDPAQRKITWQGLVPGVQPATPAAWLDSVEGGVAFSWMDATGGVEIPGGDDAARGPFPLPFPFSFFGQVYNEFHVNTNGQVLFGAGSGSYSNVAIPDANAPNNFIAAFWDDLFCPETGSLYYKAGGIAPNRYLAIEWHNVRRYNSAATLTFEAVLYEGSNDILVQYLSAAGAESGYSATVGIEDAAGAAGLQYLANGDPAGRDIHDHLAVRFVQAKDASSGSHTISFRARVRNDAPTPAEIVNEALINDGAGRSYQRAAMLVANSLDLSASQKTVDKALAAAGDALTYTITLRNVGTGTARHVLLADPLPAGTALISGSLSAGASYDAARNRVLWAGALAPGAALPIRFAARTSPELGNGAVITNTAWVSDGLASPLVLSASTLLRSPDLSASEKSVSRASAYRGDVVTYTLSIRNTAEVTATVRLTDVLPEGLAYVPESLWASSGEPEYADGTISWQGAVIGKGLALVRFAATVTATAQPGPLVNAAQIRAGVGAPLTRSASFSVRVRAYHDYLPLLMKQAAR